VKTGGAKKELQKVEENDEDIVDRELKEMEQELRIDDNSPAQKRQL